MKLLSICTLFLLSITLQARDYYVVFDENCMDRLEYSFSGSEEENSYMVYQIDISQTEKAVLEIGSENTKTQSYVPANFWRCDNADFSFDMIQSITARGDQIFIMRRIGPKEYQVSQVKFASYYKFDGNLIHYYSPKYQFEFDLETGVIGEDIALKDDTPRSRRAKASEVYFEGRLDNDCTGAFIFRQYSEEFNKPPHTDIVFVPEIGVIEERSGKTVESAFNNTLHLEKVNGIDANLHLQVACGKLDPKDLPTPSELGSETGQFTDKGGKDIGNGRSTDGERDGGGMHVVQRGETLYAIARKNKITLDQLLAWNDISKSSTIFPGDQLRVSPLQPTGGRNYSRQDPNQDRVGGELAQRGGDTNPAPYDKVIWQDGGTEYSAYDTDYDAFLEGRHIVKPGETMASIALKYGFTETKFREINGIPGNRVPRIGQSLITTECDCPEGGEPTSSSLDNSTNVSGYSYFQDTNTPVGYENFNARPRNKERFDRETPVNRNVPTFYDTQARNQQTYYESTSPEDARPSYYDFRAPNTRKVHTVADGESIYTIARKYNLTVEEIRKWNGMEKNEVVIPFQRLYIEK